ncbi:hypothetical protein XELAEV_18041337mg [Xenopus laevis]|uniref:Uncharacterized protein n=1 Tax=Xenopus laevis TaxID=8355 RepID=A0A974C1Z9_XENLA|nr:hypothetical protein XELAEV_18041337mg [Xenopus laevis]
MVATFNLCNSNFNSYADSISCCFTCTEYLPTVYLCVPVAGALHRATWRYCLLKAGKLNLDKWANRSSGETLWYVNQIALKIKMFLKLDLKKMLKCHKMFSNNAKMFNL